MKVKNLNEGIKKYKLPNTLGHGWKRVGSNTYEYDDGGIIINVTFM